MIDCNSCSCLARDSFFETVYSPDGDELGKKEVIRCWCELHHCIYEERNN